MSAQKVDPQDPVRTDEEFQQLAVMHQQLDDRLHQLTAKHYLSEPEHLEEVTLKKRKLQLKDRMEGILRRHRQGQESPMPSVPQGPDARPYARS